MPRTIDADVCIVGAGIAGLFAALSLPEDLHVVVIEKGTLGEGSSPMAQGGMAAAIGPDDDPARHLADTIRAGEGIVDEAAAAIVCEEAPARVQDLIEAGCRFDTHPDGSLHLAREGGQSIARSVHRADATGAEMVRALRLAAEPRIERFHGYALGFAMVDGTCHGVWAASEDPTGDARRKADEAHIHAETVLIRAPHTLLATGGAGALFASTTNAPASTGDGIAMAHRAGATLTDLEFVQFHPTALAVPEAPRPLLTEALRGAGALLVDTSGERFMVARHPDAELAPRHVVAAGIIAAGGAWLDCRPIGRAALEQEFPTVMSSCTARGFDPAVDLLPVEPAAHYLIGGIATDMDGRTSIPGLFAAGECAATGMHGANRMAGNSLAESVVFAARAARAMSEAGEAAQAPDSTATPSWHDAPRAGEEVEPALRAELVATVTLGAGAIRDASSSSAAGAQMATLRERAEGSPDAAAMALTGELLIGAALLREETRGVHVRADFGDRNPELDGVHFIVARSDEI